MCPNESHPDKDVESPDETRASNPAPHWYSYLRNKTSTAGILIAAVSGVIHLSLVFLDILRGLHNPYLNIWFHILLPPFVMIGFFLTVYGALRLKRKIKKTGIPLPRQAPGFSRRAVIIGAIVCTVVFLFLGFTTYTGYKYTDSVEFCGRACHVPMKPMYTAYQYSAHARVPCSSCHIGEGASWFVRSKLSGTRQVVATAMNTFHHPIETPIKNLRPARETCERCHWPEKAFGKRVVELPHFACDEKNTYRPLRMILNTGGGDPKMGPIRGIHWHFLAKNRTEYIATDHKRLVIPWVRVTQDGETRIYRSDGLPADAPPPEGEIRVMDCLDCHNRPSHKYRTPDEILNSLFSLDLIDSSYPYLKREAARLMEKPYKDTPSAGTAITQGLISFYEENYPAIAEDGLDTIRSMANTIFEAYQKNIFPEMKTDWRSTPEHIGHKYSPGCDRCHDDKHVTQDGSIIPRRCDLCHEFLESKAIEGSQALVHGKYVHPYKLEGAHTKLECYACHDGGPTPPPTCKGCHSDITAFMAGKPFPGLAGSLADLTGDPHPHSSELECIDCHEDCGKVAHDDILSLCMECHDEEEHLEGVKNRLVEVEDLRKKLQDALGAYSGSAPSEWTRSATDVLHDLDKVPPVHNLEYALKILRAMDEDQDGK